MVGRWDETLAPGTEHLTSAPPPPLRRPHGGPPRTAGTLGRRIRPAFAGQPQPARRAALATAVAAAAIALDTIVATGQVWLMRSGGDCASAACSVATLGGRPGLCLALALTGLLALLGSEVAAPITRHLPQADLTRETVRAGGMALSVVATAGAVTVATAAFLAALLLGLLLVVGVRGLGGR